MKAVSYKKYKVDEKLKIYSGAPVNKGFYNRNLNKAHKLYIDDNWQPPKPKKVKKFKNEKFSNQLDNYMNDYKMLKQKFNFPQEEKEETIVIQKDSEEFEEQKMILLNTISENFDNYLDKDFFKTTDNLINDFEEDNYNENSLLKTTQTLKDYEDRLSSIINNNQNEMNSIFDEEKEEQDKNESLNKIKEEAKIEENNEEQIDENNEEHEQENNEVGDIENNNGENNGNLQNENNGIEPEQHENSIKREEDNSIKREEDNSIKREEDNSIKREEDNSIKREEDNSIKREEDNSVRREEDNNVRREEDNKVRREEDNKVRREDDNSVRREGDNSIKEKETDPTNGEIINQRVESQHESKVLSENNQAKILGTDDDNDEDYHF